MKVFMLVRAARELAVKWQDLGQPLICQRMNPVGDSVVSAIVGRGIACEFQVTEEVAAHLKEGGITVKPYGAMLDDVRKVAASGLKLWTDPAKASVASPFMPLYLNPLQMSRVLMHVGSLQGKG